MKKVLVVLATAIVFSLPFTAAHASPSDEVSGSFTVEQIAPTSARMAGRNCIIEADVIFSFTGDLEGDFSKLPLRIVHKGPCDQPAAETFHGQGTYEGTAQDVAGTFRFNFVGTADEGGNAQARITVLQGTGGLVNLHGTIELAGVTGVGGTYSGAVHFDP